MHRLGIQAGMKVTSAVTILLSIEPSSRRLPTMTPVAAKRRDVTMWTRTDRVPQSAPGFWVLLLVLNSGSRCRYGDGDRTRAGKKHFYGVGTHDISSFAGVRVRLQLSFSSFFLSDGTMDGYDTPVAHARSYDTPEGQMAHARFKHIDYFVFEAESCR